MSSNNSSGTGLLRCAQKPSAEVRLRAALSSRAEQAISFGGRPELPQHAGRLEPVHDGHGQIQQDRVVAILRRRRDGLLAVASRAGPVPHQLEQEGQRGGRVLVVVNDENARRPCGG